MGMASTSLAAASPPLPFGQEVIPLTEDEMEEVDGAWGATLVKTAVGAAVAGASYLLTTPGTIGIGVTDSSTPQPGRLVVLQAASSKQPGLCCPG